MGRDKFSFIYGAPFRIWRSLDALNIIKMIEQVVVGHVNILYH